MRKLILLIAGALALALPSAASATTADFQGVNASMTVVFANMSGGGFHSAAMVQKNKSRAMNMRFTFDNVSGVISNGSISYPDTGFSMSFSGTGLAPTASKMMANLQVTGVMPLDPGVTYDPSTGLYTGSGRAVEFTGAAAINTIMSMRSRMGGGFGGGMNFGSSMGGGSGMGSGGGFMGGGTGGAGGVGGRTGGAQRAIGMVNMTVIPTNANVITVTDGTPDRSNPQPVMIRITVPAFKVTGVQ